MVNLMLNPYEIAMLLTIGASFVFMMFRLYFAIELQKKEKEKSPHK